MKTIRTERKNGGYKVTQKASGTEYYVTSLAAIYDLLTPDIVGCGLQHLWNSRVASSGFYENKKIRIEAITIHSKKQNFTSSKNV